MNAILELWNAAKLPICILLAGILWVIFSLVAIQCEVPASGAVLVGCAIAAEFFIRNLNWIHLGNMIGYVPLRRAVTNPQSPIWADRLDAYQMIKEAKIPEYVHPSATDELDKIRAFATLHEYDIENSPDWNYRLTARRLEIRLTLLSAICAITGTIIWGYAHLLFGTDCLC